MDFTFLIQPREFFPCEYKAHYPIYSLNSVKEFLSTKKKEDSAIMSPEMENKSSIPVFSFVLPAFNEEENIETMTKRLVRVGEQTGDPFEIIWIDDGSTDQTGEKLDALLREDSRIRVIHLSRNFGHMAALTAGMEAAGAKGAVITLDSDGQHPPEMIPEMIERWRKGAEIVQTVRVHTKGESGFKRTTSRLFYRLYNFLSDFEIPEGAAEFRLLDRQVVDVLKTLPERARFLRGLVHWVGFRLETFSYQAGERKAGDTKYGLGNMISLAITGITSFSIRPLRLTFMLGAFVLLCDLFYGLYVLYSILAGKPLVPGWTSLILVTLSLSGFQLIILGMLGEYIGRLYQEIKQRPIYICRKKEKGENQ